MSAALPASEIIKPPSIDWCQKTEIRSCRAGARLIAADHFTQISAARRGCARGLHQRTKERSRKRVTGHAFRMPLHAENPVLVRFVLNSLDHAIGCNRGNAQAMPKVSNRLVMRGVYPYVKSVAALLS